MNKIYLCTVFLLSFALTACSSGAVVGIGGGGGSYGAGGGVGISFPVGGEDTGRQPPPQTSQEQAGGEGATAGHDPFSTPEETGQIGQPESAYIGSNLDRPYPKHDCYQPMKPSSDDSNSMFMIYKQQLDKYRLCIDTYAKNAKNDMMDIEAKANSALREYRMFVSRP